MLCRLSGIVLLTIIAYIKLVWFGLVWFADTGTFSAQQNRSGQQKLGGSLTVASLDQVAKPKEEDKKPTTLDGVYDQFRKETQKKPKTSASGVRG